MTNNAATRVAYFMVGISIGMTIGCIWTGDLRWFLTALVVALLAAACFVASIGDKGNH